MGTFWKTVQALLRLAEVVSEAKGNGSPMDRHQETPGEAGIFGRGRPSTGAPPHAPGVYRWRDKENGRHAYIGESADLARRKRQHERSGRYSEDTHRFEYKVAREDSTSEQRRPTEKAHIEKHGPSDNRRAGGGGRKPKGDG